ncbi:MAG: transposase, partial [Flavobacteriaceae bacterium]|nr:transposase [Flavobacteriaceae bacterium]
MAESSYYRKPSKGRKGLKPSILTSHSKLGWIDEKDVISSIKKVLGHEFIDCGYRLMTAYLKRDGCLINHKKVYRIMSTAGMLKLENRINRSGSGRKFV